MRYLMTGGLIGLMGALAVRRPVLVDLLYDDRYAHAGAMLVLIALAMMPAAIGVSYDRAALAAGDSATSSSSPPRAAAQKVLFLLIGVHFWGIVGAIAGLAVQASWYIPSSMWLSIKHKVWDPEHDAVYAVVAAATAIGAILAASRKIQAMAIAAAAG
ncbi:MAG: hypothetical protein R3D59_18905 [Paracoccaceae bacterium]